MSGSQNSNTSDAKPYFLFSNVRLDGKPVALSLAGQTLLLVAIRSSAKLHGPLQLIAYDFIRCRTAWKRSFLDRDLIGLVIRNDADNLHHPKIFVSLASQSILDKQAEILALDQEGNLDWKFTRPHLKFSKPLIIEDELLITTPLGDLVRLDIDSGLPRGEGEVQIEMDESPHACGNHLIFPGEGTGVKLFTIRGDVLLDYQDPKEEAFPYVTTGPEKLIYALSRAGKLIALNWETGHLRWEKQLKHTIGAGVILAATSSQLYIAHENTLYSLNSESGERIWTFTANRQISGIVATEALIYLTSHDHHIYALDQQNGKARWKYRFQRRIELPPVIIDRPSIDPITLFGAVDYRGNLILGAQLVDGEFVELGEIFEKKEMWKAAVDWWRHTKNIEREALAFRQYALMFNEEGVSKDEHQAIWLDAVEKFRKAGLLDEAEKCFIEISRINNQPLLRVNLESEYLVLNSWSMVTLSIKNVGSGTAYNIFIKAKRARFEGQINVTQQLLTLSPQEEKRVILDIRPLEFGPFVPLQLEIHYNDDQGSHREEKARLHLPVLESSELADVDSRISVTLDHDENVSVNLPRLRQLLNQYFDESELRALCFDMNINYADLPAIDRSSKIIELIKFAIRHNHLKKLLNCCQGERPKINWQALFIPDS